MKINIRIKFRNVKFTINIAYFYFPLLQRRFFKLFTLVHFLKARPDSEVSLATWR